MTARGIEVLWSHWRRNPWQLLTLLVGIALSTALWSGVQAINAEARASYAAASNAMSGASFAQVVKVDGTSVTYSDFVRLRRLGIPVSPALDGTLETPAGTIRIFGIDPLSFPSEAGSQLSVGSVLTDELSDDPVALVHPSDVGSLDLQGVKLVPNEAIGQGTVLMDIAIAHRVVRGSENLSRLILDLNNPSWNSVLLPEYKVLDEAGQTDVVRLTQSFHLNLTAFGLLSFAVGIFIVYGAVGLAFEQRRGVFRTLRALGVSLRQLMILLVAELAAFAIVAGFAGVGLGYLIAAVLLPDVAATLRGLYGADVSGQLQLRAVWWVSGLGMALGGTAIAAAAALYKLSTMPVLAFNHPRAMSLGATKAGRFLALGALGLWVFGVLVSRFSDGLLAGFVLLGCLMIGAALMLPWSLDRLLALAQQRSQHAVLQWFWADSRQQLPALSMALMALMLAMAANIGVSTMVSSFRLTFVGYLDQRLSSELYISARSSDEAARIVETLENKVDALLPIVSVDSRINGLPVEIFGVVDHATYRDNWPILQSVPEVWDRLAAGEGVLVNEQLSRRLDLDPGEALPDGDVILGVYSDYGNAAGQIILAVDTFALRYPGTPKLRYGIRTSQPEEIVNLLHEQFQLGEDGLINQDDLKRFSLQVFERTFAVTAALNVLTLSVAALAIFISLLTLATMRLPQLAPVWALGLTRGALSRLELLRALCLASLTALISVPVGLSLAWVLLAIVNVEAFGWRLPMYLFPMNYLWLSLLSLMAAFCAALWPAIRLARTDPQRLLAVFSNER